MSRVLAVSVIVSAAVYASAANAVVWVVSRDTTFTSPAQFENLAIRNSATLTLRAPLAVSRNLELEPGALMTHPIGWRDGVVVTVGDTLIIRMGASIDLSGRGLLGGGWGGNVFGTQGQAFDGNGNLVAGASSASNTGAGASHAGWGGSSNRGAGPNVPYGILEEPQFLGAGGGRGSPSSPGGLGGGHVRIAAAVLQLDGNILANGQASTRSTGGTSGAGAGGSIRIDAGVTRGVGRIEARGGDAAGDDLWHGGAGGGGRIAVYSNELSITRNQLNAQGGTPTQQTQDRSGSSGTIYLHDTQTDLGTIVIDSRLNASTRYTPMSTQRSEFRDLAIRSTRVRIVHPLSFSGTVDIGADCSVAGSGGQP